MRPRLRRPTPAAIAERLDGIFDKAGSVRLLYDDDGKRRLAYEIRRFQKGHYVTVHYLDEGAVVPDLERSLRLDESVLRFLTVRIADRVTDVEERKKAAQEEETIRAQKAAERAAREAEERAAREAEERERAQAEAEAAASAGDDDEEPASDEEADDEGGEEE